MEIDFRQVVGPTVVKDSAILFKNPKVILIEACERSLERKKSLGLRYVFDFFKNLSEGFILSLDLPNFFPAALWQSIADRLGSQIAILPLSVGNGLTSGNRN